MSWRRLVAGGARSLLKRQQQHQQGFRAVVAEAIGCRRRGNSSGMRRKIMSELGQGFCRSMSTVDKNATAVVVDENAVQQQEPAAAAAESKTAEADEPQNVETSQEAGATKEKTVSRRNPVSWLSFLLMLATGAIVLYYYDREKKRKVQVFSETSVKYGPSVGKAAIGGPLKLTNHEGKIVTEADFLGNWTLIYFGFTSCPDICPDELQKMMKALDLVEKRNGLQISRLFISIDPERDKVEQMKEYVQEFHPKLVGLTGSPEDVKKVAKAFRVYYMKTGDEGDDDYLVDHSIIMYLMDKDWEFVKFFGKDYTVDELADGIAKEIKGYKPKPKSQD